MKKRKTCKDCNGTGEQTTVYAADTWAEVRDEHPCRSCFGRGYVGGDQDAVEEGLAELHGDDLPGEPSRAA